MKTALSVGLVLVFVLACLLGGVGYFEFAPAEKTCIQCHEIRASRDNWTSSAHRAVSCKECHGGSVESVAALQDNTKRIVSHILKDRHDDMRLSEEQTLRMNEACGACHASEYAHWKKSGHGTNYAAIFADEKHNRAEQVNPQCLQCHGMFYKGGVEDLISPLNLKGPWTFNDPAMASRPVISCVSCHRAHVKGEPFVRVHGMTNAPAAMVGDKQSLAFYVRGEKRHFAASELMVPRMVDRSGKRVKVSADPAHRMCVQCHAPNAQGVVGSSDDKTPTGVHEGLSCTACHNPHSGDVRDACVKCHAPGKSVCKVDVRTMDTSYFRKGSTNSVHHLTCVSCHAEKKPAADLAVRAGEIQQMKWGMFICWSLSTFSGKEWSPGIRDLAQFRATEVDTDQWARTAKEAGMGYILFLAKHHDGFCLWDTKTTDRKVTRAPLGKDVLALLRKSCDKYGIKLALYFSEGDWSWPGATDGKGKDGSGIDAEKERAQLTELLTEYGPIEYMWVDHAAGTGGLSHQEFLEHCRKLQPRCWVGFNHGDQKGTYIRIGEMGRPGPLSDRTSGGFNTRDEPSADWRVAEFTYPILPAHKGGAMWFYSLPEHDGLCHSADKLFADYRGAVKYGNIFSIDVGPDYAGRLRAIDVQTLQEVGRRIRAESGN